MNVLTETQRSSAPRACVVERLTVARVAVALCFFVNGVLFATWVSRIPAVQAQLGLGHAALGMALLCMAAGALLAMPFTGWCATRFGSDRATQVSALLYCALLPFLAQASTAGALMLILFAFGAAHGAFDVAMNSQAVAVERQYGRPVMSSFHALWSFGGLAGAATGAAVAKAGVLPVAHFTIAAIVLGGIASIAALPHLLQSNDTVRTENSADHLEQPGFAGSARLKILALGAIAFSVMIGEGAMADWSAIYLRDIARAPESIAALGYGAFSIAMACGRLSGDFLTARFGGTAILRAGGLLAAAGVATALALPQSAIALPAFMAVGLGFSAVVPVVFSAAGRIPGTAPGVALATATTIGYFGFLLGPPLIGFIAEAAGLRTALAVLIPTSFVILGLAHCTNTREAESDRRRNVETPRATKTAIHVLTWSWLRAPLLP